MSFSFMSLFNLGDENKSKMPLSHLRNRYKRDFFRRIEHDWIKQDNHLKKVFENFIDLLDRQALNYVLYKHPVLFLKSNGKLSCTFAKNNNAHIILVFPELYRYLCSAAPDYAYAIMAHEIGHIIYHHDTKEIDPIQAQVEADRYTHSLGLGRELANILEDQRSNPECQIRLTYLTSLILGKMDA